MKCLFALISIPVVVGFGQLSNSYSADDFGSFQVAGACSVTAERISCWDMSGKPDASMSEAIDQAFSRHKVDLSLKFKKKNRLIVLRHQLKRDATTHFRGELYAPGGEKLKQAIVFGHNADPLFATYWYYPSETETTLEVTASLDVLIRAEAAVPLKEGSEAKVAGYKVKIDGVKASDSNIRATAPYSRTWVVDYSVEVPAGRPEARFNAIPVDAIGDPITAIDSIGFPLSREMASQGSQLPASFSHVLDKVTKRSWISKVNPEHVAGVRVNGVTTKKVTFKAVPLDPQK